MAARIQTLNYLAPPSRNDALSPLVSKAIATPGAQFNSIEQELGELSSGLQSVVVSVLYVLV